MPATGSATGHAQVAKKCKKSKSAVAAKKKCKKKKKAPVVPPTTTPPPTDTTPTPPLDTDTDGDGVPDASDNCVNDSNPDQGDADADDHGDVCDACPQTSNPGSAACPPQLDYMNVSSPLCVGTNLDAGSVVLTAPAAAETAVSLISSAPSVATVPGSVIVSTGQTLASFDITGLQTGSVEITAILGGDQWVEPRDVENCP